MAHLRFWTLTIGTTLLIWIAADQRVATTLEVKVPFSVKPVARDSMTLNLIDSEQAFISILFRGPNRKINQLKALKDTLAVQLPISERQSGPYRLNLADELRRQPDLFPAGLAIVSVFPPTLTIEVDRYVKRSVKLVVEVDDLKLDGIPHLDPSEVMVTVGEESFNQLPREQRVILVPAEAAFSQASEGEFVQKPVVVPKKVGDITVLRVEPAQVTLSGTLQTRTEELVLRTVPIWLQASNEVADRFKIILDEQEGTVTRSVTVRGPVGIIRTLKEDPAQFDIKGLVEITLEEAMQKRKPGETIPQVPQVINLPPGVEQVGQVERVDIQLIERDL